MELSNIQSFLEAYRKRLNLQQDDRTAIVAAIISASGVQITEKDMTINKGVITLKIDTVTRNHIFLYKTKILEEIKKSSPKPLFDIK
jgi:hypothetical protein